MHIASRSLYLFTKVPSKIYINWMEQAEKKYCNQTETNKLITISIDPYMKKCHLNKRTE